MVETTLNNRYHLESEIGRGGMGVVYRARDLSLNRAVAVKVLPAEFTADAQFQARFKNEVLNVARLDHPHIAQIYDVGQDGQTNYYVMQLVEGSDLHTEVQRRGRFSLADTYAIICQLAMALDHAHRQGIVHRDIKPENVLLNRQGQPFLVDFGIARAADATRLTGGMIGTPEYMSPEQARGEELDGRSDQYSFAIVVYEMLTGTTPFRTSTSQAWALVNMHITTPPPDPRQWQMDLPDYAAHALLQALAKGATERFPTCVTFSEALRGNQSPQPTPTYIPLMSIPTPPVADVPPVAAPVFPPAKTGVNGFLVVVIIALLIAGGWLLLKSNTGLPSSNTSATANNAPNTPRPLPQPSILVNGIPASLILGQSFTVDAVGRNDGDTVTYGSVTLSMTGNPVLEIVGTESSTPHVWLAGEKILSIDVNADSSANMIASEGGAEAYFKKQLWGRGGERHLQVRVTPIQPGTLIIKARCTINYGKDTAQRLGAKRFYTAPAIGAGDAIDQQGLPVKVYQVEVTAQ